MDKCEHGVDARNPCQACANHAVEQIEAAQTRHHRVCAVCRGLTNLPGPKINGWWKCANRACGAEHDGDMHIPQGSEAARGDTRRCSPYYACGCTGGVLTADEAHEAARIAGRAPMRCATHGAPLTKWIMFGDAPVDAPESKIDHPNHYGGADNVYEAIKVIEAWGLGFCLGNAIKYIARAGRKNGESTLDDLKKARWYLDYHIKQLELRG